MGETDSSIMDPPSAEEFLEASKRGYKAALLLAGWTAEVSTASLEAAYAQCAAGLISAKDASEFVHEWERDEQEDWEDDEPEEKNSRAEWQALLQQVRDEAAADMSKDQEAEEFQVESSGDAPAAPAPAQVDHVNDLDRLSQLPDGEELKNLFSAQDELPENGARGGPDNGQAGHEKPPQHMYRTLLDAVQACQDGSSLEWFDKLWRHLMFLRYWSGGMDSHYIKNPRALRRKSTVTHWYRCPGCIQCVSLGSS